MNNKEEIKKKTLNEKVVEALSEAAKRGRSRIEVVIREGKALEVYNPVPLEIVGTLDAPLRYIKSKDWLTGADGDNNMMAMAAQNGCLVTVNKERGIVTLYENETSKFRNMIQGQLTLSKVFAEFDLNGGKYMSTDTMARFLKLRRGWFKDQSEAMSLIGALMAFDWSAQTAGKSMKDTRGNYNTMAAQTLTSNLPETFTLCMPIFKGGDKVEILCEIDIEPSSKQVALSSIAAEEIKNKMVEDGVEEVIEEISRIAPAITIMEV